MSRSAEPLAALFAAAKAAQANAYAPYSRFKVGAALRTPGGAIYSGGNVENAAYPEGVCAETSAVSAMAQAGERRIAEICVIGDGEYLCTRCGGCRQRIRHRRGNRRPRRRARRRACEIHPPPNCCRNPLAPAIFGPREGRRAPARIGV